MNIIFINLYILCGYTLQTTEYPHPDLWAEFGDKLVKAKKRLEISCGCSYVTHKFIKLQRML